MPLGIALSAEGVVRPKGGQMSLAGATKPQCFLNEINPIINHPQDRDGVSNIIKLGTPPFVFRSLVTMTPHLIGMVYGSGFATRKTTAYRSILGAPTPNQIGSGDPHVRSPVSEALVVWEDDGRCRQLKCHIHIILLNLYINHISQNRCFPSLLRRRTLACTTWSGPRGSGPPRHPVQLSHRLNSWIPSLGGWKSATESPQKTTKTTVASGNFTLCRWTSTIFRS